MLLSVSQVGVKMQISGYALVSDLLVGLGRHLCPGKVDVR